MRWLLTLLLLGCSTPAQPLPALDDTSASSPGDTSEEYSGDAGAREVVPYLCAEIDEASGVTDYFPRIRPTLSVVVHRWDWPILIGDHCESPIVITVGDVPDKDGEEPGANVVSQNGGAVLVGGSTVLTLSRYRAERLDVVDFSEFDCDAERSLLSTVLAHEIGHILGMPHKPDGLMADRALPCRDLFPSAGDIGESIRPG